ncbi:hypothetical protein OAF91_02265 [Akkermansiaceae bacterium]|nr:hypothetical protein [Akkermansiaceae bacterium]
MSEEIGQVQNCYIPPTHTPSWARLSFQCQMQWHQLEETANPAERHCSNCHENVYLVTNKREFEAASKLKHCVSIQSNEFEMRLTGAPPRFEDIDNEEIGDGGLS